MIVVTSPEKLEIGKEYRRCVSDGNCIEHENTPIFILKEATFEDWLNFSNSHGYTSLEEINIAKSDGHYYLVSID